MNNTNIEEMTPYERVAAMYCGEETDRVVLGWVREVETGIGLPSVTVADVVREKSGYHLYKGIKTLYERYRTDLITIGTYTTVEAVAMGTKDKYFVDQLPAPIEYVVKCPDDLEKIKVPDPRSDGDLPCLYNCIKRVVQEFGNKALIGCGTVGPFSVAARIRGLWDISYDIMKRPWFVHDVLKHATEACESIIEGWHEAGAMGTGSGAGSETVLGKEHFREFVVPYERMYLKKAKKLGFSSYSRHICSGTSASIVINNFVEFGLNLLPTLVWGYYEDADDMNQKKKIFSESAPMVAVGGVIRAADTITFGSPAIISREVEELVKKCAPGGKYVHIPECSLPPTVPLENLDAYVITARKIGRIT